MSETKRDVRGFAIYLETKDTYGQAVRVKQSSAACVDAVWIFCKSKEDVESSPHLDIDGAKEVIAALQAFVQEHTPQIDSTDAMLDRIRETIDRKLAEGDQGPRDWKLLLSKEAAEAAARHFGWDGDGEIPSMVINNYQPETRDLQGAAWAFVPKSEMTP